MASIIKVDQIEESTTGAGTSFPYIIYADNDTTANTPVLSFIGDTNTGIGRSAADTLDLITAGNSRFRIESTGQIKATYESTVGTDYNTTLHNGYFCRAWVNIDGVTPQIRSSGNVTSIVKNLQNDFTINFTTEMPDINYITIVVTGFMQLGGPAGFGAANRNGSSGGEVAPLVGSCRINGVNADGSSGIGFDMKYIYVGIFR